MAKGKGKSSASAGPKLRKMHGPKRHMFKDFKPMVHVMHENGLLNKYYNYESWVLACAARGKKNATRAEFKEFVLLKTCKEKDAWFASLAK